MNYDWLFRRITIYRFYYSLGLPISSCNCHYSVNVQKHILQEEVSPHKLWFFTCFCSKCRDFFLYIVTLTVRTFDFRFSFKFFNREENSNLMVAVFTDILISGHTDLLIVRWFAVCNKHNYINFWFCLLQEGFSLTKSYRKSADYSQWDVMLRLKVIE